MSSPWVHKINDDFKLLTSITLVFDEEGTLLIETNASDEDFYYDEISSGLLVREIRRKKQDLFESLSLYYKVVILGEDVGSLLDE